MILSYILSSLNFNITSMGNRESWNLVCSFSKANYYPDTATMRLQTVKLMPKTVR